ncbi:MAG TPA: SAM-dependent methyltransferase [Streptosporangiaceae bacterium]|nr:SAM-dependent methyltransferase [Streptosporangiaceae bacterium]
MPDFPPLGIDASRPNVARVYDYFLGGKDNFAADRELAERLLALDPGLRQWFRDNRAFVCAAVARAVSEGGVTQFLDLGAGLPTRPSVHEAAWQHNPDAKVVYIDLDPVAVLHAQALLPKNPLLIAFQADLTDPPSVLDHPDLAATVDLDRPVGVILGAITHLLPADVLSKSVAAYVARLAPGSWLMISGGYSEDEETYTSMQSAYTAATTYRHSPEMFASFFTGMRIVPPGVVEAKRWVNGLDTPPPAEGAYVRCAAGIKP